MRSAGQHPVVEEAVTQEDTALVRKATHYEAEQEFLKLFLLCEENRKNAKLEEMYQNLKNNLERYDKMDIRFFDEDAIWFFKRTIIMGRVSLADFPISNQALSRMPIRVGIKDGEGFLEIENKGSDKVNAVEIEKPTETVQVRPEVEFSLGTTGKIILSVCFPIEFRVYKDRFLTLKILNPEECIRKQFHLNLSDIWKDFNEESSRTLIIGK